MNPIAAILGIIGAALGVAIGERIAEGEAANAKPVDAVVHDDPPAEPKPAAAPATGGAA